MSHANGQQFAVFNYPISADHEHFLLIDGKTLPLKEFSFAIHVVNSRGKMLYKCCEVTSSKGNDGNVPLAQAVAGDTILDFAMSEEQNPKQIALRIDRARPASGAATASAAETGF
jgi:hypothetical protein